MEAPIAFKVKGIRWRAGYAERFGQTPLGAALSPDELPPTEAIRGERKINGRGISARAVNPHLDSVLLQLLPSAFVKAMKQQRRSRQKLRRLVAYHLPDPTAATMGFAFEYTNAHDPRQAFHLYLQTPVGPAPAAIIDECIHILASALPEGENADDWDEGEGGLEDGKEPSHTWRLGDLSLSMLLDRLRRWLGGHSEPGPS